MRMRACVFDGKRNWEYSLSFVTGKWKTFFESKLFQVIPGGGGRRKERGKFPARNHWNDTNVEKLGLRRILWISSNSKR